MDADAAAQIAEKFLDEYTNRDEFFNADGDPVLLVQQLEPSGDTVKVVFTIEPDQDAGDPALAKLATAAIDALRAAHPELKPVKIVHEIFAV